ncbi:MAG: hypothetical protein JWN62_1998 [Acidimicrobiales bacterium]|nr:hypothetical protein [Acidimicrobiales bacterium]
MSDQRTVPDDRATRPLQPEKSLGDLFGELTGDLSTLFRQEVQLAKTEATEELKKTGTAAGMMAVAGLGGWMALLFISLALAWLLDQAMNTALAFLIVGVIWAVMAAVLFARGKRQISSVTPIPETRTTIKEDVQWAKTQKS